ncbi:MAG: hypothetical protein R2863_10250 [Candidatus Kapaibacterium sp.]|nr:hypothetical protein [Ignavibacteriota bacterium]
MYRKRRDVLPVLRDSRSISNNGKVKAFSGIDFKLQFVIDIQVINGLFPIIELIIG